MFNHWNVPIMFIERCRNTRTTKSFLNSNSTDWVFLCLVLLLALPEVASANSENLRFTNLTMENGLSSNNFFASDTILQDSRGYLWFGTIDGLNRYDGYEFKHYRHQASNPESLTSNFIQAIFEDSQAGLWVLTHGSQLNRYNPVTDRFSPLSLYSQTGETLQPNLLNFIEEDSAGTLWMADDEFSLLKINTLSGETKRYARSGKDGDKPSQISSLFKDDRGTIWIGTIQGLEVFDPDSATFFHFAATKDDHQRPPQGKITKIYQDKQALLWIGTETGLWLYEYSSQRFTRITPSQEILNQIGRFEVISIADDSRGWLWLQLANNKGLLSFHYARNQFAYVQNESTRAGSLCSNQIADTYVDRANRLWIGSRDKGVCVTDTTTAQFGHVLARQDIVNGLSSNAVKALLSDSQGNLWIGTMGEGLDRLNLQTGQYTHFKHRVDEPQSLSDDRINALFEDSVGNIWIGFVGGVVSRFEPRAQQITRFPNGPTRVRAFSEDLSGNIWIASIEKRLSRYHPASGELIHFPAGNSDNLEPGNRINEYPILTITNAKNGDLWLGNSLGLIRFNPRQNTSEYFYHKAEHPASLSKGWVLSLYEDDQQKLWVGTLESGLNRYDPATGHFTQFGEDDGLAGNIVYAIEQDRQGYLWVSTNKGLSRIEPQSMQIRNYRKEDGLQDNDFNLHTSAISASGELFFGGINGFNQFYPHKIVDNDTPPPLVLTDFKLFNRSVDVKAATTAVNEANIGKSSDPKEAKQEYTLAQSISETRQLNLSYRQSFFSFDFAAINARKPNTIQYFYTLEGWNERWIETDANNRKASYTNIPAGDYTFRVKIRDPDALWQAESLALPITITPPLWLTWWAKVIYGLFFIILLVGVYYLRTATLRKRSLALEETVRQRTRQLASEKEKVESLLNLKNDELTNISHEFRTPLTLILGGAQQLLQQNPSQWVNAKATLIKHNASRLLRMVEQLLHIETAKVANITSQASRASHDIIARIADAFVPMAREKNIEFTRVNIDEAYLLMAADALDKIVLNLLSNAFKYTPTSGHIQLSSIINAQQQLEIRVKDSGIGIPPAMHQQVFERFRRLVDQQRESVVGAGIGLALVKELVELHKGSVSIISEENQGAEFIVTLPIASERSTVSSEAPRETSHQEQLLALELMNLARQPVAQHPESEAVEHDESRKLILVVEDNAELRGYIRAVLATDYQTIEACDGKSGFELALTEQPDVIISDVMMPRMDGFQLASQLKACAETDHIPLILLTAKVDKQSTIEGILKGADDYLTKPFNNEELSARIGAQIAHKKRIANKIMSQLKCDTPAESHDVETKDLALASKEDKFITELKRLLQQSMNEETFDVEQMWQAMNTTRSTLFRQVKKSFDCTPNQLLKNMRLAQALQLLRSRNGSISEVAYAVGFQSLSTFSRAFSECYQLPPSRYKEIIDN
jgi:ligand-binding sensor domain-containing protein/signal transduction histidine kinase/DNA-binding response OmpR family regulator